MKSLLLMGIIVFSRLGGIFLLFVLLARLLAVEAFGSFVVAYSIAAVIVLVVDYGFAQSLLKEIGSDETVASERLTTGLLSKLLLACFALLIAVLVLWLHYGNIANGSLFFILFFNAIFNSFSEYFGAAMRSTGRYAEEAGIQFVSTLLILGGVYGGGSWAFDAPDYALLLMAIKLIQVLVVGYIAVRSIGIERRFWTISRITTDLKRGVPYAADQGVSNFLMNVDVLIVGSILGAYAAGIYQAGQKLVQGYSAGALIISNVFLPRLARNATTRGALWFTEARRVAGLMGFAGCAGGALLVVYPELVAIGIYGERFAGLSEILPLFGVLIVMRFISGTLGLYLTSIGLQTVRLIENVISLFVVIVGSLILVQSYGVKGMLYVQITAVAVLFATYSFAIYREVFVR
jgi:O-antigen/teichoic acid export membrane protein